MTILRNRDVNPDEFETPSRRMSDDRMLNYDIIAKMVLTADFKTGRFRGRFN